MSNFTKAIERQLKEHDVRSETNLTKPFRNIDLARNTSRLAKKCYLKGDKKEALNQLVLAGADLAVAYDKISEEEVVI